MKKVLLILIVSCCVFSVQAQKNLYFGVKTAYSHPKWKWNMNTEPSTSGYGFTVGGFSDYHVHPKGWLRAEIDYSLYNFNLSENNGYDVSFLEIPITFNVTLTKGLSSYFGLGVGFKMSDDTYWLLSDNTITQVPILSNYKSEYVKTINVFFPVGVAYIFDFGMFVDVRMNVNLNDMSNSSVNFIKGVNTFDFGFGFKF